MNVGSQMVEKHFSQLKLALCISLFACMAGCAAQQQPFDSAEWKKGDEYTRKRMVGDLLGVQARERQGGNLLPNATRLQGLRVDEVVALLGNPERQIQTNSDSFPRSLYYPVGFLYEKTSKSYLMIGFDESGVIETVFLSN